eukprot:scaffold4097_cov306-Pinguiococcus_pyrenoidosus.AAC.1
MQEKNADAENKSRREPAPWITASAPGSSPDMPSPMPSHLVNSLACLPVHGQKTTPVELLATPESATRSSKATLCSWPPILTRLSQNAASRKLSRELLKIRPTMICWYGSLLCCSELKKDMSSGGRLVRLRAASMYVASWKPSGTLVYRLGSCSHSAFRTLQLEKPNRTKRALGSAALPSCSCRRAETPETGVVTETLCVDSVSDASISSQAPSRRRAQQKEGFPDQHRRFLWRFGLQNLSSPRSKMVDQPRYGALADNAARPVGFSA